MEEIYQSVWCQTFTLSWPAGAVAAWDESKRLAAIVAKNKEQP